VLLISKVKYETEPVGDDFLGLREVIGLRPVRGRRHDLGFLASGWFHHRGLGGRLDLAGELATNSPH
jgi:hypothetical protein